MSSGTMRIPDETMAALREVAAETGTSPREVLVMVVEEYQRKRLLDQAVRSYATLSREHPEVLARREQMRAARAGLTQDRLTREARKRAGHEAREREESQPATPASARR